MRIILAGILLLGLAVAPAAADDDECREGITRADAIEIARGIGLVRIEEVQCDDGRWEIEGRDAQGREIEMEIEAHTGRVTEVERERSHRDR